MAGQLGRLLEVGELPNVSLRIMPFRVGLHHGIMSGPFVILRFPLNGDGKQTEPPTVYVDSFTGALFLDKPGEVARYDGAFKNIWSEASDEAQSTNLIAQVARELRE